MADLLKESRKSGSDLLKKQEKERGNDPRKGKGAVKCQASNGKRAGP